MDILSGLPEPMPEPMPEYKPLPNFVQDNPGGTANGMFNRSNGSGDCCRDSLPAPSDGVTQK